ncbi:MAG: hypothetical protein ABI806_03375 [Candidatus Solibacter sp.]
MLPTRREVLWAAAIWPAIHALHAARKDFWESKEPPAWTAEEKDALLGDSPWARAGVAQFDTGKRPPKPYEGITRPGGGTPGANPGANNPTAPTSVPFGEKPPPVPTTDTGRDVKFGVLARWESAAPIQLAGGPPLPAESAKYYVIRLRGMPLLAATKTETVLSRNQDILTAIEKGSRIERKETAIPCAHLLAGSGDAALDLLLFFERSANPITVSEKVVTLECTFRPFNVSIKFPLKEMLYRGTLAL